MNDYFSACCAIQIIEHFNDHNRSLLVFHIIFLIHQSWNNKNGFNCFNNKISKNLVPFYDEYECKVVGFNIRGVTQK